MAKKNFDDFINAAGKRKKPSPEEVDELSRMLHQPEAPALSPENFPGEKPAPAPKADLPKKEKTKRGPKAVEKPAAKKAAQPESQNQKSKKFEGKEKVRVTIDLSIDLYRKLKMRVVLDDTDLSTFVRDLLERNL